MLKNIKLWLIGFAILFLAGAVVTVNIQAKKIKKQKAEIERIANNNYQLMADNLNITNLNLKDNEVIGRLRFAKDSLAKALKIKPNQVERIIYIDNSTHDTVKVPVFAEITGLNRWKITDQGECFKWAGNAFKQGDSLKVQRTLFEYNNRTTQVFWKQRPHKFLFIKYGTWQYSQKIESDCGQTTLQSFTFLKK
jgi:hypothetical protein